MRATKAYIASLGTTGVLLAASILMLAVVSAVVAFDAWPGSHVSTRVQTLVLPERAASIRVSANATGQSATQSTRPAGQRASEAIPRIRLDTGNPGSEGLSGGTRTAPAAHPAPAVPQAVTKTVEPVQQAATPIFNAVANPRTTAGQVADGAQALTNAAAGGLTELSPDVAGTVSQTGAAAADAVRQAPLPEHVIPGH